MRTNGPRPSYRFGWLMLVVLISSFALGQTSNTGEIKGTVTDSSGATIPGVKVSIANVQTGVVTVAATNEAGIYDAPSVPTGEYKITFAKSGFRDFVRQGVTLQLQTVAIDAQLQVGAAAEQVIVTAEVPLLQTETSDQTTHFDTKAILDAPIVGGVWYSELTKTLPGVSAQAGEGVAVNGMQNYSATYSMEGTNVTDPRDVNVSDNYPPIDAIQEVDVNSANGGAQNGYSPLTLNLNLKSGTNNWHGSLFEFNQNDFFESRNLFDAPFNQSGFAGTSCPRDKNDATKCKKAPQRWNEFGGSFGGPIVKNKVFFFFTYQRNPVSFGSFQSTTVPTLAMRNGDFTATDPVTGNFLFPTVYDSSSCAMPCARTPLNGGSNMISSGQIDPVAAAILSYIPKPTDTNNTHLTDNFSTVVSTPSLGQWYVGKVDYNLSSSHRLSGSIFDYPQSLTFNADALCGLGFDCTRTQPNNPNRSVRISETWTVSPTVVNEFRVGAMREHDQYAGDTFGKGFLKKLGIQPAYGSNAPVDVFPNITVDLTSGIGVAKNTFIGGGIHANLVEDMYNASDVVTLIRGKHTVKLGGELDRLFQHDTTWGDASSGNFEFNGVGTKSGTASDPRTGGTTSPGVPFADFLLGDTYGWFIFNGEPTNVASWLTAAFVNDDFKVTPRLTLNLGLRYQHQTGYAVADGRFANFDPKLVNPASYLPANSLGAMRYGSIDGRSNNTIEPSVNSWAPRVGFAWSPREKWSIRASYGLFQLFRNSETYARDNYPANLGFGFSPQGSFGYSSNNPAFALSVGPPPNSVFVPTASNLTADAFNFQVVANYPTKIPLMYDQQFLLSVQRELPASHVVDVSYVHTKGSNLQFPTDINQIPQSQLLDPNPSGTGPFGTDRPVPWFQSILSHEFTGYSNYNALQFRVQKRTSHGLYYQFNYAWSKLLDTGSGGGHASEISTWQIAGNPRANYGLSDIDAAHVLTGTISYELPFGSGRMFPVHGIMNQIIGGWRLSSVITARSGSPFTVFMNQPFDTEGSGQCFCGFGLRPDRIGSGKLSNPTISQWFDLSAFAPPASVIVNGTTHYTFGDSGRNILLGPRQVDTDLSLGKNFKLTERLGLEFRADSYNVFNHPQFNNPSSSITFSGGVPVAGSAGQITSANGFGPGRIIQLGGRVSF